MSLPATTAMIRDSGVILGSAAIAQLTPLAERPPVTRAVAEFGLYIGLAVMASVCRAFYDARGGKAPAFGSVRRSAAVALFIGLLGGAIFMESDLAPGWKMATILVAAFFFELTVSGIRAHWERRLERAVEEHECSRPHKTTPPRADPGSLEGGDT